MLSRGVLGCGLAVGLVADSIEYYPGLAKVTPWGMGCLLRFVLKHLKKELSSRLFENEPLNPYANAKCVAILRLDWENTGLEPLKIFVFVWNPYPASV